MEAGKSRELQAESASMETQESQWFSSSPKTGRLKTQEEPIFQFESEGRKKAKVSVKRQAGKLSLIWNRVSLFVLFRPSTDWMRATHVGERNLLYSNLYVNLIQKHPHRNIQNNV